MRSDSSTAPGTSDGSSSDLAALLGVLHQRAHAAAVGRLGAVVAGRHQQQEAHHDLVVLEPLAVELRVHEHAREVVGRRLAAFGDQLARSARTPPGTSFSMTLSAPSGVASGSPAPTIAFIRSRPHRVVLGREAHEAADHARDHRLRDVVDQVARLAGPSRPVEHLDRDRADRVLVLGDPLRREAALEERLQTVVLGRVHADEHRLLQLQRQDRVLSAVKPPTSEEKVCQSRLTSCTSSAVVTDQKPSSSGYSVMPSVQCTGHSERSRRNSSCGGPSWKLLAIGDAHLVKRRLILAGGAHDLPFP